MKLWNLLMLQLLKVNRIMFREAVTLVMEKHKDLAVMIFTVDEEQNKVLVYAGVSNSAAKRGLVALDWLLASLAPINGKGGGVKWTCAGTRKTFVLPFWVLSGINKQGRLDLKIYVRESKLLKIVSVGICSIQFSRTVVDLTGQDVCLFRRVVMQLVLTRP